MKNSYFNASKFTEFIGAANFNYAVNISLQNKYVYVETPKAACSTVKSTLQKFELTDLYRDKNNFDDIHDRELSPLLKPSQVGDFSSLIQRAEYTKFCFVRNPYSRLLSVYLDKIQGNKVHKKGILAQLGHDPEDIEHEVSFEEFVKAVASQPIYFMNPHWRVQYYQTLQNCIKFDYIGKIENFDHDFATVISIIFPDKLNIITTEKRHASNASEKLKYFYNDELRDIVYTIYKKDFDFFNYPAVLDEISIEQPNISNSTQYLKESEIENIKNILRSISDVGKKDLELNKRGKLINAKNTIINEQDSELKKLRHTINLLNREINTQQSELKKCNLALEEQEKNIISQQSELKNCNSSLEEHEKNITKLKKQISEIENSNLWKIARLYNRIKINFQR